MTIGWKHLKRVTVCTKIWQNQTSVELWKRHSGENIKVILLLNVWENRNTEENNTRINTDEKRIKQGSGAPESHEEKIYRLGLLLYDAFYIPCGLHNFATSTFMVLLSATNVKLFVSSSEKVRPLQNFYWNYWILNFDFAISVWIKWTCLFLKYHNVSSNLLKKDLSFAAFICSIWGKR